MATIDYELSSDSNYYIVNGLIGGTSMTNLVIDDMYAGLPVKEIAANAFSSFKEYTITGTLTLPDSLTYIGDGAFIQATGLTGTLTLPNSLTYIGDESFLRCKFTGYLNLLILTQSPTLQLGTFGFCNFTTLSLPNTATYNSFPFESCSPLLTNIIVDEFNSIDDSGIFLSNPITTIYFVTKNNTYNFSLWQSYNLTAYAYIDVKNSAESLFSPIYYEQLTSNIIPTIGDTIILSWFTPLTFEYEYILKINGNATDIISNPGNIVSISYTIDGTEGPSITFQLYKIPDTIYSLSELTFTLFDIKVTPDPILRTRNGTISWNLPQDTYSLFVDNTILSSNLTSSSSFPLSVPFTTNLSVGNHKITMYSSQWSPFY